MATIQTNPILTHCATHPQVETGLRCGKCGTPICPRCLVYTPVGTRCATCAQMRRLPIFNVTPRGYAVALVVGIGSAFAIGCLWGAFMAFLGGLLGLLVAAAAGYTIGELISSTANRKRSRGLQVIAGASTFLSYLVSQAIPLMVAWALGRVPALPAWGETIGALTLNATLGALDHPFTLLAVALAIFIAVYRLR